MFPVEIREKFKRFRGEFIKKKKTLQGERKKERDKLMRGTTGKERTR